MEDGFTMKNEERATENKIERRVPLILKKGCHQHDSSRFSCHIMLTRLPPSEGPFQHCPLEEQHVFNCLQWVNMNWQE